MASPFQYQMNLSGLNATRRDDLMSQADSKYTTSSHGE
jgi:hypothetical protein